jgi:hypothetical protein
LNLLNQVAKRGLEEYKPKKQLDPEQEAKIGALKNILKTIWGSEEPAQETREEAAKKAMENLYANMRVNIKEVSHTADNLIHTMRNVVALNPSQAASTMTQLPIAVTKDLDRALSRVVITIPKRVKQMLANLVQGAIGEKE